MKFASYFLPLPLVISIAACSPQQNASEATPIAGEWTIDDSASHLSFVTVKAGTMAEAHVFDNLSGSVRPDGQAMIEIDLTSLATGLELRDERMRSMLFETGAFPKATVTAQLDPAAFEQLAVGQSTTVNIPAELDLHGMKGNLYADLSVTRAGADTMVVSTIKPVIVQGDAFNLGAGVERLREVAGLPSITNAAPVAFSLVFTR